MTSVQQRFAALGVESAPGQPGTAPAEDLRVGHDLPGEPVDFSHGDVDAFTPTPGSFEVFRAGVEEGGAQAYTEYKGRPELRELVADRLARFTGAPVEPGSELIITPGTQGALFLAIAALVGTGDQVAVVQPDYFANRKLVEFFGGQVRPVRLAYEHDGPAQLDLGRLEEAFRVGARTLIISNPSNPTGAVLTAEQVRAVAELADRHGATVIVDQLYSRLLYPGTEYTHLRAAGIDAANWVTIMGPSKTESLSGYRLGVAFGSAEIIARMEQAQAIVSLRAPGYSQAVLRTWFDEPDGWLEDRIRAHQAIRDDLVRLFEQADGFRVRPSEAGSYLFPRLPALSVAPEEFVRLLRLQAGVVVTPGAEFSPHHADSVRLNFSQDRGRAAAAVERLIELADRYRR